MNGTQDVRVKRRSRRWSRLFVAALVLAAGFAVVHLLAPQTIGETARRKLIADLQRHYEGRTVSIRRGSFDPKVGLTFEGVIIGKRDSATDASSSDVESKADMVRIDRLTVLTNMHPEKLLDGNLPLHTRGLVIEGVHANAWLTDKREISLAELWPLPRFGPTAPRMVIRDINLKFFGGSADRRPMTANLKEVLVTNEERGEGQTDRVILLRGSADFADDIRARADFVDGKLNLRCAIKGAHIRPSLFDRLPVEWTEPLRDARELECLCDATLAMHRSSDGRLNYQLRTTLHDGRFEHPMLPKPLSELRGVLACDPNGVTIEASQGNFGDAIVRVSGKIHGYQWPCETSLKVSTRGLLLDDRLARSLPQAMQTGWNRLRPLGRVDADAEVTHTPAGWNSRATLTCKGVDVRYEKFPYPVENVVGNIEIADGIAKADTLMARVGGNRMQCAFRLPIQPGTRSEKSFVLATDGPIPIDRTLLAALSPRGAEITNLESFVRSLRPRGSVQLTSAVFRTDLEGNVSRKLDLRVIDGHLHYEKFAYPLYNVTGNILVDNDLVTIAGMRANNANAGTIRCDGTYRIPNPIGTKFNGEIENPYHRQANSQMVLRFHAIDVPMDESLRSSLPHSSQQVWDAIAPSGVLDELSVKLERTHSESPLDIDLTATQLDSPQVTSRTLSLRPESLPYRLDVTAGSVRYDGSKVTIDLIRGRHDASTLSADGFCVQTTNGRWELLLNLHGGSRLHPDVELIAALPSQMRVAMRALQLRGPISLRGQTRFVMPDALHPEPAIQWDLVLQLEGNRIADVGPVHSLRGEISVQGIRDEQGIRAMGDIRIDSMHADEIQITGIHGPFSIEGDILHLGRYTQVQDGASKVQPIDRSPSIGGKVFDGDINLDGNVILSSGNFDVGLTVQEAQLPTFLADFGHSDQDLTGTISGQAQLQGNLGTTDLLRGSGAARVTGANLYKLPLIVQVLNLLRIKATEDVAFTDGEVEFTLYGEALTFSDLHIWGDLVALQGGGTLNRRQELDLTFNTRVSPQNSFTQLIRPLGQRYTLWTIDVHGPLHALEIERKALERVSETLEWLIPGMAEQQATPATQPNSGPTTRYE